MLQHRQALEIQAPYFHNPIYTPGVVIQNAPLGVYLTLAMHESDPNMEILAALVAGLLALVGGYFGAWSARRTDYEKWLRQERGAVFGDFLKHLHNAWVISIETLNDASLSDSQADLRITEQFVALESQQNIVRLYLFEGDRETFTDLVRRLWAAQSRTLNQGKRMEVTRELVKAIQFILENRLHS